MKQGWWVGALLPEAQSWICVEAPRSVWDHGGKASLRGAGTNGEEKATLVIPATSERGRGRNTLASSSLPSFYLNPARALWQVSVEKGGEGREWIKSPTGK